MNNVNKNLYSLWKKDFVNLLFCIVAKVMFFWKVNNVFLYEKKIYTRVVSLGRF